VLLGSLVALVQSVIYTALAVITETAGTLVAADYMAVTCTSVVLAAVWCGLIVMSFWVSDVEDLGRQKSRVDVTRDSAVDKSSAGV